MNSLMYKLGLKPTLAFGDVFGIDDPDLLSFVPRPAHGLLLIFPVSDTYEKFRREEDDGKEEAKKQSTYDPHRTLRALFIGGVAAIPGYHWFLFLARNFNYTSKAGSIVLKVLINQIVFTPIFNTYFFGLQSLLTGAGWSDIVERVKHTVPRSWYNSWKLWPAVTAFSFAFIRVELRGLFAGVIAIGWQTYLSILNQRAARLEKAMKVDDGEVESKLQHA